MAIPSIVSYTISSGDGNSVNIPMPTGVSSGNILMLFVRNDSSDQPEIPNNFTILGDFGTIFNYTSTFYGGYLGYKQSNGAEPSGLSFGVESGKYIAYLCNVDSTGIIEYRQFNENIDQATSYTHGCKLPKDDVLVVSMIGGISPLMGDFDVRVEDVPFDGIFHSGISFYSHSDVYDSGYSPNYIMYRPTGYPYENSGYLAQFPPALFSFGYSVAFG